MIFIFIEDSLHVRHTTPLQDRPRENLLSLLEVEFHLLGDVNRHQEFAAVLEKLKPGS